MHIRLATNILIIALNEVDLCLKFNYLLEIAQLVWEKSVQIYVCIYVYT